MRKSDFTRLTKIQRSPYHRGISEWNLLPDDIQNEVDKCKFKERAYGHIRDGSSVYYTGILHALRFVKDLHSLMLNKRVIMITHPSHDIHTHSYHYMIMGYVLIFADSACIHSPC